MPRAYSPEKLSAVAQRAAEKVRGRVVRWLRDTGNAGLLHVEAQISLLNGQKVIIRLRRWKRSYQHLTPDPQAAAEEYFHKAIDIARQQQAKSLELRAVTSLSRLWQKQGKREEAHKMLAEIYGWFTEGFDTADLKEAKALLEELA